MARCSVVGGVGGCAGALVGATSAVGFVFELERVGKAGGTGVDGTASALDSSFRCCGLGMILCKGCVHDGCGFVNCANGTFASKGIPSSAELYDFSCDNDSSSASIMVHV